MITTPELKHVELSRLKDVVLVEITTREFRGPDSAQELSAELARVAGQDWAYKLLVNCKHVRFFSSTAFAALVALVSRCKNLHKQVRFCQMSPELLLGAQIIGLDKVAEIDASETEALAAHS